MKKRALALAAGLLIVGFVAIQLVPNGRAHDNPPVISEPQWDSPRTRELFFRTCGDCHSNQTRWPWYSNIAPISWLVQRDVDVGRAACNVSEWGQAEQNCGDSAEMLAEGSMPPRSYVLPHPSARLDAAERDALVRGLLATFGGDDEERESFSRR